LIQHKKNKDIKSWTKKGRSPVIFVT